ncbi:hypothetical protein BKI52_44780 [marine bacterium AO1-C]|nr:hypothetical protein BKI52_44780 [marine bacterium AO1-C]
MISLPLLTTAQVTQTLVPEASSYFLTKDKLYYLEDADGKLSFEQVQQKTFSPVTKNANNFGVSASAFWFRFKLQNPSAGSKGIDWLMELAHPLLDQVALYIPQKKGWKKMMLGDHLPFGQRPIHSRHFVIPLDFTDNTTQTYYLRLQSTSTLQAPITIYKPEAFYTKQNYEQAIFSLFYGILLVMSLYNLFLFFSLKSRPYLLYSLAIFVGLVANMSIKGQAFQLLWPQGIWLANVFPILFTALFQSLLLLYTDSFLKLKKYAPRLRKFFFALIVLSLFMGVANFFNARLGTKLSIVVNITNMPFVIAAGIICYRKGLIAARFFILAWVIFASGVVMNALTLAGVLPFNFVTKNLIDVGGALNVILLSLALADSYQQFKREKEEAQRKMLEMQQETNEQLEQKVQERTQELQLKNNEVLTQNEELQQQQEEIMAQNEFIADTNLKLKRESNKTKDSIQAASAIQNAILPSAERMTDLLGPKYFVLYQPKDIVSGDFYWISKVKPKFKIEDLWQTNQPKTEKEAILQLTTKTLNAKEVIFIAVVDCTGHGVPGAFMSMIGNSLLNEIINESLILETDKILTRLNEKLNKELRQNQGKRGNLNHGMDVCLCKLEKQNDGSTKVHFTGAKRPLYYINQEGLHELRGDRISIGGYHNTNAQFTVQTIELQPGDMLYLTTDGMVDSPNPRRKSFGTLRFKNLMEASATLPIEQQGQQFAQTLEDYRKGTEQRDDITVLGLRV